MILKHTWLFVLANIAFSLEIPEKSKRFCSEVNNNINLPCLCSEDEINGTDIYCDGVTFLGDFPVLPHRYKIRSFSQRGSGLQSLEAQLFTASDIPLQKIDFSDNLLRRITERTFDGIEDTLKEINLSNNKLGDQLNALFSTGEFQRLKHLENLDLSGNEIKEFQAGIFNGLTSLQELKLERNFIITVPRQIIQSLKSLKSLNLQSNYILDIGAHSFPNLTNLQFLNLSSNDIITVQNEAFVPLSNLKSLILSNNQIQVLDSGFLDGLQHLEHLDLSQNLLEILPVDISAIPSLKTLILYSNKIRSVSRIPLNKFVSLEYLDLRRNRIYEIPTNGFADMKNLKELHLDINTVRKVSSGMFIGLENLSDLTLNDNRILAFPSEPLNVFKNLKKLNLDYNRIAAISREILAPANKNKELSLAFNLISEIPDGTFTEFKNLELLNLHGNKITDFSNSKTEGLENSLLYLDIGYNEISELPKLHFSNLLILSIAKNKISRLSTENFALLSKIIYLNVSYNMLSDFPPDLFTSLTSMENLDLQHNLLKKIPSGAFKNLPVLEINVRNNHIQEINAAMFENLLKLKSLDLSFNKIENISVNAFSSLPSIENLNLMGNALSVFRGDEVSGRTNLRILNLSYNNIAYLFPNSFNSYSEIEYLDLSFNALTFFPHETINNLASLMRINLAGNKLQSIGDRYFSNMPHLKQIDLQNNVITSVSEFAFQNSSSLRKIFLQKNQISLLYENTFYGLNRLELDISKNNISSFPSNIFSRSKGLKLEQINIAENNIRDFPNEALKKQYSFLEKVNISHNSIRSLPSNADVLVNIKELDLSYNPLLPDAHYVLFGEPKSVRKLYVQGVDLMHLPIIECPFLRYLNIKENKISKINSNVFNRTNMLTNLDVSYNMITDVGIDLVPAWIKLPYLQTLDFSGNPIRRISKTDFNRLFHLKNLKVCNFKDIIEINCDSLHSLPRLRKLQMYGFQYLQQMNIKQCLQNMTSLDLLEIEMKDSLLKDQLQAIFSPKLDTLSVSGQRLRSVSSSAFAGMLSPVIKIQLTKTSIDAFSDKIFLPLPLSSEIEFKIPNNKIQRLSPEMLSILDNKQVNIVVHGANSNPINCDCNLHFFWHWLQDKTNTSFNRHKGYGMLSNLMCMEPSRLQNRKIKDLKLEELVCEEFSSVRSTDSTPEMSTFTTTTTAKETTVNDEHPFIIFEQPVTKKPSVPSSYIPASDTRSTLTKVDTMIIGIVAGVVAFVCILIIIICIIRLRRAHPLYTAGPLAGPLAFRAQGKCTCLKPPPNNCTCYPMYSLPYAGRPSLLPNSQHKMLPSSLPPPPDFLTTGQSGRLRNTPYFVTYPDSDNENK
ncbi:chaoptin [Trichonephila inaurata madagascariensis]|uniref:Chaoptin n=1 Tax=Trichonephila inaurata madagascariensis TaxID=2747483 RepID=A0A8X6I2T0_9ARAC|nr:chaoptin [Trichonephila inaurata madagascariensis]